jgi:hypothetical protein
VDRLGNVTKQTNHIPHCDHTTMIRACSAVPLWLSPPHPTTGASWPVEASAPPDGRPAYLTDHGAAAEKIGRLRWTLTQVIALATTRPG